MTVWLGIQLDNYSKYNGCKPQIELWMLVHFLLLYTSMLALRVFYLGYFPSLMLNIGVTFFGLFVFTCPLLLVMLFNVERNTPECRPQWIRVCDWTVIGIGTLAGVLSSICLCAMLSRETRRQERMEVMKLDLKMVYEKLLEPGNKIMKLLRKYKDIIDNDPLSNRELSILQTNFTQKCATDYDKVTEEFKQNCGICIEQFKVGEEILKHPKCLHRFHPVCLKEWLRRKPSCPMCKLPSRSNMLLELHKILHESSDAEEEEGRPKIMINPPAGSILENPLIEPYNSEET